MNTHAQRGQALVEFAVSSAVALLLILGILDFGRAFFAYDLVTQAARLSTRYAIVNALPCRGGATAPCESAIKNYLKTNVVGIDPAKVTPTFTWEGSPSCTGTANPGCAVTIEIDYTFNFVALPLPAMPLKSVSQMVISQ